MVVIEPFLTDQWFVNAEVLAQPALASVRERAHQVRARELARTPISPGWRTSNPGASRASSGGAIRSRPGTARALNTDPDFGKPDAGLKIFVADDRGRGEEAGARPITAAQVEMHTTGLGSTPFQKAVTEFEQTQRDRLNPTHLGRRARRPIRSPR